MGDAKSTSARGGPSTMSPPVSTLPLTQSSHNGCHRPSPMQSSRSPKRVKATPPSRPLASSSAIAANSDCIASSSRSTADEGSSFKSKLKSPWRSPAWPGERQPRKNKDGTVPMLSQTLSTFSLSHTSPTEQMVPHKTKLAIPSFPSFSSDGPEPGSPSELASHNASLPYSRRFLASPFTRTGDNSRGAPPGRTREHDAYRRWQESMPTYNPGSSLESPTHFRSLHASSSSIATIDSSSASSSSTAAQPAESPSYRPRRPPMTIFPKHQPRAQGSELPSTYDWHNGPPIASAPLPAAGSEHHNVFEGIRRASSSVDLDLEAEDFFFYSKPPSSMDSPVLDVRRCDSDESMISAYSSSNGDSASSNPSTLPTSTFILPSPLPLPQLAQSMKTRPGLERRSRSEMLPSRSMSEDDCEMLSGSPGFVSSFSPKPRRISDPTRMAEVSKRLATPASTPVGGNAFTRSSSLAASSACKVAADSPLSRPNIFDTPSQATDSSGNISLPSPSPLPAALGRPDASLEHKRPHAVSRVMAPLRATALNLPLQPGKAPSTAKPSQIPRPSLRRGATEPHTATKAMTPVTRAAMHDLGPAFATPPLFSDEKPSPAAFASTGLVKKKGGVLAISSSVSRKPVVKRHSFLSNLKISTPNTPIKTATVTPAGLPASRGVIRAAPAASCESLGSVSSSNTFDRSSTSHSRGLRRKGSAMLSASGGSGSWGMDSFEPMTPSKHAQAGLSSPTFLTTPSPPAPMRIYPFASTVRMAPSHSAQSSPTLAPSPVEVQPRNHLLRRIQPRPGPVARASNPLLSAAYKAGAVAAQGCSGGFSSPALKGFGRSEQGRLERDFVIIGALGRGEFSDVLKVKEKHTGGLYAVKRGKPYTGSKDRLRQLQEVAILRQLSLQPTSHILRFVDFWEQQDQLYIRTELADCGDLATFLEAVGDTGGLGEARVWKTLAELSTALSCIHDSNLIHLDLKPANILVTASGSLKIADFGMSTRTSQAGMSIAFSPPLPSAETDGFAWGTETGAQELEKEKEGDRAYLAPEGLMHGRFGREADIYSLGIMILEAALNVVLPENGDGWRQLRADDFSDIMEHYHPEDAVNDAPSALPKLSETLLALIKKMMAADPERRPTIKDICNHPVVRRARQLLEARRDTDDWSDTDCDETDISARAIMRAAGPALVHEDVSFLATILRTS